MSGEAEARAASPTPRAEHIEILTLNAVRRDRTAMEQMAQLVEIRTRRQQIATGRDRSRCPIMLPFLHVAT
jgi:hypothetical protein